MTHYKPKYRRKGIMLPYGYFVSPIDPSILLPDQKKLESLEYSFRMRAQYKTALRDCVQWLHQQTGQRMTPSGYLYAYRRWVNQVKKLNGKAVAKRKREATVKRQKFIEENFGQFSIKLDDKQSVCAVAQLETNKEYKAQA